MGQQRSATTLSPAWLRYKGENALRSAASWRAVVPAIGTLEKVSLGGLDQWVLFCGASAAKPILLFLHGGPGMPSFPFAHEVARVSHLHDCYRVAYWEQRGTGKSYSAAITPRAMTIEQFVSDTIHLARLLRARFGVAKVFLLGHSWGTIIGTLAAQRAPELFYAYVGMGQVVHMLEGERLSYQFVCDRAHETHHTRAIRELTAIGPPPHDPKRLMQERKWVVHFRGNRYRKSQSLLAAFLRIARTPEYTWRDVVNMARHPLFSLQSLLPEMYQINFFDQVPRMEIPVYFLAGRHDYTVPSALVERYERALVAPQDKHLLWFEESAHFPFLEEPAKFTECMCGQVAAEADPAA